MKRIPYILALCAFLLTGCRSEEIGEKSLNKVLVKYSVTSGSPAVAVLTKGVQVNTTGDDSKTLSEFSALVGTFVAKAYDDAGVEKVSQTVTWSEEAWEASPVAYWPQAAVFGFLAYANLPEGQSAEISSSGVSSEHTVPVLAPDQTDILFGHYYGDGGNTGTAEIRFEHPLTAVRFVRGEVNEGLRIRSISIEGVAQSGTTAMGTDGTISWTGISAYDYTVSQEAADVLSVDGTTCVIGEPFLLIPQNLSAHKVKVKVTFSDGILAVAEMNSGEWLAGKTNTYTLAYNGHSLQFELTSGGSDLNDSELSFEFEGGSQDIVINSIIKDQFGVKLGDKPWTAELSFVGAGSDQHWAHLSKTSGDGGEETITISTEQNPVVEIKSVTSSGSAALKSATPQGTADNRTDLSDGKETANCYLVGAPGFYKLPLVYGNARKSDGTPNTDAFKPSGFSQFTDHAGSGIEGPNIYDRYSPADCCLIWQDEPGLVKNVSLSADGHFLQFDVEQSSIIEGNAVVAVRDASGTVLWSWHIWVTDYTLGTGDGTIKIATPETPSEGKRNIVDYTFAARPIGYCSPKTTTYKGGKDYAKCVVTIRQEGGAEPLSFTIYNNEGVVASGANETYYQWGRKDPMPGGYYTDKSNKPLYYDNTAYTFAQDNSRQSRDYSIKNPHKLIYRYGALGEDADWENTTSTRFNAWNATSVGHTNGYNFKLANYKEYGVYTSVKTVYDPSPVGYKVPVHYPFLLFVPMLGSNPTIPTSVDGTYMTTPVEGYEINALEPVNDGDLAVFFPRTAFRAQATGLDNGSWGVYATCSPSMTELKSATFGFTASAGPNGAWNPKDGCPNNMLGLFIATAVQPIREETVEARDMKDEILFEDNFGTAGFSSIASYDKAGMADCRPYNFKLAIDYAGGANTSVSTNTTNNMSGGHLRYSSKSNGDTSTITIENIRTFGAPKVTLTFDAYISSNTYISTHTVSVGGLNAQTFTSKSGNSFTFTIDGDDPVDIVFNIKHNNSTNTGTVGIDNVKLTFNY